MRHSIIALGGGILLGAVAIVLVPKGVEYLDGTPLSVLIVLLGGLVFLVIEKQLNLKQVKAPQMMGMVLDYVPEAIALGGLMATGSSAAVLLAILIGLQNLPEGFNSHRELSDQGFSSRKIFNVMLLLVCIGPIAGVLGHLYLSDLPEVLGSIMLFCSGGILYLTFQDIAPQVRLASHWAPPLGAVLGFSIALLGHLVLQKF